MARYVSPLREAQAAQTRRRVLEAAARAFGESGYAGASLAGIARDAGVSLETVKQNGPKASLLLASFDLAFAGSEGEGPLHGRELGAQSAPLGGEELLAFQLDFVTAANARVARLWPRLLEAAAADAEVARRLHELQGNRRTDMLSSVAVFREKGLCRSTRSDGELADALSFLISPESYTQLVSEAGWSRSAYQEWLARAIRLLILQD
ncbi:TetR family transcriptional regulator [Georgenia sp. TF02-10]|uniref:TetR/AcrR family transcriptional regulator n=1 Tax=Georgenia sp. TF02-10 TaxID=2917725 RepID=UPI001FA74A9F|nr:TetR family transcriptional regulator [Georgenia sp. TF02-10]UNX54134.1 TetR family transcriptional regulator [Georgenia sp. TF02-10]